MDKNYQSMSQMDTQKVLVFIDFDHTIVDCNSDLIIKSLAGSDGIPEHIEKLSKAPQGWTTYMSNVFKYLHEHGISKEDYINCLAKAPLVEGMKELLKRLHEDDNCEIIILSDSNTFFINFILQYHQLTGTVSKIFTNPAEFDQNGCLQINKFQEKNDCSRCPDNLCKGYIMQNYLTQKLSEGLKFKVLYIGDGHNDVCPALKLTANDCVFARVGYRLLKNLEKIPAQDIKPIVIPWVNGYDILK